MAGQIIARGRSVWLVRTYLGRDGAGKRVYQNKTIHGNKKDAEAYLIDALRQRDFAGTEANARSVLVSELLDDVLTDYKINHKDHDWAERKVRLHLRPTFGGFRAGRVTTSVIQQHVLRRKREGVANATINRELAILKRAFNLGRKQTPPKVIRVPYIPMLEENNVRKGFFEHEEYLRMRDALPEEIRPLLIFAYYTGCRKGEILSLKWEQVDLENRIIRLDPGTTKNDEPRVIPVTGDLLEMLKSQRTIRDELFPECDFVFFREGQPVRNFRKSWDQACVASKLAGKDGRPARLFHDLRRTGVRNLMRAGVPERIAMAISGHKTRSVFDRYNIVSETDLKDAARKLDSYLAGKAASSKSKRRPEKRTHTIGTQGRSLQEIRRG
jgi:integrase